MSDTANEKIKDIMGDTPLPEHTPGPTEPATTVGGETKQFIDKEIIANPATGVSEKMSGYASDDLASSTFDKLFGINWQNFFEGTDFSENFMSAIFEVLANGVLTVAIIALTYLIIVNFVATTKDGAVLGRRNSSFWGPVKMALGMIMLFPVYGGFTLAQSLFLSIGINNSVQLSNQLAATGVDLLANDIPLAKPLPTSPINILKNMYYSEVCMAYQNTQERIHESKNTGQRVKVIQNLKIKEVINSADLSVNYKPGYTGSIPDYINYQCQNYATEAQLAARSGRKSYPAFATSKEKCEADITERLNAPEQKFGVYYTDGVDIDACGGWDLTCRASGGDPKKDVVYQSCLRSGIAFMKASDQLMTLAYRQISLSSDASIGENNQNNSTLGNALNCDEQKKLSKTHSVSGTSGSLQKPLQSSFNAVVCDFNDNVRSDGGSIRVNGRNVQAITNRDFKDTREAAIKQTISDLRERVKTNGFLSLITYYFSIGRLNSDVASSGKIFPTTKGIQEDSISQFKNGLGPQLNKAYKYLQQNSIDTLKGDAKYVSDKFRATADLINPADPINSFMEIGGSVMDIAAAIYATSFVTDIFASTASTVAKGVPGVGINAIGAVVGNFSGIISTIAVVCFVLGLFLVYVLGLIPLVNWVSAFIGWIFSVFAIMLALPFWCIGAMFPDGDSLLDGQYVRNGVMVILSVVLKPITMVIGFWFAYIFMFIGASFVLLVGQLFLQDQFNTEIVDLGHVAPLIAPMAAIIMLSVAILMVIQRAHSAYYKLDDMIMRGLGYASLVYGEEADERHAVAMFAHTQSRMEAMYTNSMVTRRPSQPQGSQNQTPERNAQERHKSNINEE